MSIDPIAASDRIRDAYYRYLRSAFPLRQPDMAREFDRQLEHEFALAKGPYVQATAPFETGASIRELVEEGVLSSGFLEFSDDSLPLDRPLYLHQEQAIRKSLAGRNLMISTGTGSGKTECFLIPIFDTLFREAEAGTLDSPGVRALLLYPMNALANDQLKRLREILGAVPEITFGRYTGDTKKRRNDAENDFRARYPGERRLDNELIAREEIQAGPPQILLTNYAMLEYLLLRPADSALFDGPTGEHWRYLALDEVHVYSGSSGTEVGMLLRRVKDRIFGGAGGDLSCFGTSATMGRGEADYPKLVDFGKRLFGESFEWEADHDRQDVVGATRKDLSRGSGDTSLDPNLYAALVDQVRNGASLGEVSKVGGRSSDASNVEGYLADLLVNDQKMVQLQEMLEGGAVDMSAAAIALFGGSDAKHQLRDLIDLGVHAKHRADDSPLLPARYHFFLRALEGAFVCLHPEHAADRPFVRLSRHKECPTCLSQGIAARMFELGVCQSCGAEYLTGKLTHEPGRTIFDPSPTNTFEFERALLDVPLTETDDDEDEAALAVGENAVPTWLCPACGSFSEQAEFTCDCGTSAPARRIWMSKPTRKEMTTRQCLSCAKRAKPDPVRRFRAGSDGPVSVIATDLYQEIPPSSGEGADEVGEGRKLLAFSDSRQDAAFFAPYLERTYGLAIQRRIIAEAISSFGDEPPRTDDLVHKIVKIAEANLVLDEDDGNTANRSQAETWIARELLAMDRRISLEGTGVAEIRVAVPRKHAPPPFLEKLGFADHECLDLYQVLLDSLRSSGAIQVPDGVNIKADEFAPRNREIGVREMGSSFESIGWMPASGSNRRLDFLKKVLTKRGINADPVQVLKGIWIHLTDAKSPWRRVLVAGQGKEGPFWKIDASRFEFEAGIPDRSPFQCDGCGQLWWKSVSGVCPGYRCEGSLAPVSDPSELTNSHYATLYADLSPVGMTVEEHTAQWVSAEASAIQERFVSGMVNVLSCSTTFELGVDVGEVEAVLLRNVPPTAANYVQRAGRAGRRTDSAALVVTFAQLRSHDFNFFEHPESLVNGVVPPPRMVLDNGPIVRRHVHSIAFAAFQREAEESRNVGDFFVPSEGEPARVKEFERWLRTGPTEVGAAVKRVVPKELAEEIDLDGWGWVDDLMNESEEDPTVGWMGRAAGEVFSETESLQKLIDEADEEKDRMRADRLDRVKKTLKGKHLIAFLASRNVLPKYGFPVDVVELNLARTGDSMAGKVELSRDLRQAIVDYAPGSFTVAGKKLWQSQGLATRFDQGWPTYGWTLCANCGSFCHSIEVAPEQCPTCHAELEGQASQFVMPVFGFVGEASKIPPGDRKPPRLSSVKYHFGSYRDEVPEMVQVDGLPKAADVTAAFSRQGLIIAINEGPLGAGFRICEWCGYGEPIGAGKAKKEHPDPRRPGKKCGGTFKPLELGHRYLTDVVELAFTGTYPAEHLRSALYAMLEASPTLDIDRADIDGTIRYSTGSRSSLVIFDAVPGGAGYARRLAAELPALLTAARERVEDCECGEETSCYSCLRSYANQYWHEDLTRRGALSILNQLSPTYQ